MTDNDYRGLVIAVGALAVSGMVFFLTQIRTIVLERPMLAAQRKTAAARKESMHEGITRADEVLRQREERIQKVQRLEGEYALLLTDLLELSEVDPDARAITIKWKIQEQGNPSLEPDRSSAGETNDTHRKVR